VTALALDGLTVSYNGHPVVDGVSMSVSDGSWVCLIGPNGAGKTTVLRALSGAVPYRGSFLLGGAEFHSLGRRVASRIVAVVPQDPVIPPGMSAADYVMLGRTPHLGYLAVETARDRAVVRDVMERLDCGDLAERRLDRLSGGERQRVVLARALAQEPSVMLLDEPTSALDIGHQQQVLELVEGLRRERGVTVLSALHDLTLAAQYADRLVLLDRGAIVADGSPGEVLTEDALSRFSGARVEILRTADGSPVVVPRRRELESRDPAGGPATGTSGVGVVQRSDGVGDQGAGGGDQHVLHARPHGALAGHVGLGDADGEQPQAREDRSEEQPEPRALHEEEWDERRE
jgi:iron complex transport system ATP-binding protein